MKDPFTNEKTLIGFGHFSKGGSTSQSYAPVNKGYVTARVSHDRLQESRNIEQLTENIQRILKIKPGNNYSQTI